jgi:hypothetical protein
MTGISAYTASPPADQGTIGEAVGSPLAWGVAPRPRQRAGEARLWRRAGSRGPVLGRGCRRGAVLGSPQMATWRERRAWRAEFKSLGTRQVRDRERISAWYQTPGKLEEAGRWLREQERRPYLIGAAIGALATIAAAVVAALISAFLR